MKRSKIHTWAIVIAVTFLGLLVLKVIPVDAFTSIIKWLFGGVLFRDVAKEAAPEIIERLKKAKEQNIEETSDSDLAGRIDKQ